MGTRERRRWHLVRIVVAGFLWLPLVAGPQTGAARQTQRLLDVAPSGARSMDAAAPGGIAVAELPPATTVPAGPDSAIPPPPEQFEGPPAVGSTPVQLRRTRAAPGKGTWAVVVGINDYPGSKSDLRSAVNDANDMDEALAGFGVPGERRLVLRDGQATADSIRRAARWLTDHAGPDAVGVFFYAGHVRKVDRDTEVMVAADGVTISDAELASMLDPLAAPGWIVIAGCYSGGFTEVLRDGRILTAASGADDLSYENSDFGRSYLVEYVVRRALIQGRARQSVEAAFAWADDALRRDYPNRLPVQFDQFAGELDLSPRSPPSAPARPEPSPQPQSPPPRDSTPPPTSPPPKPDDGCASFTLGVVRCGP